ncbi:MAG: amidohydrolase family protein [Burkholderiales bacterium]|nr:amidohydrolase family protein [Burkholderiales bacterium]
MKSMPQRFALKHALFACLFWLAPSPTLAYDGPIVDAHKHWAEGMNVDDVRLRAKNNNVTRFVIFPRHFGRDGITEEVADRLAREHGDIFWVLIGLQKSELIGIAVRGSSLWDWHHPPSEWKSFLAWARDELLSGRRHGLGELTAKHYAYTQGLGAERDLPLDSVIFNDLLRLSAETKRPFVLHAEAEKHVMAALEKQLTEVPGAILIWAHACGRTAPGEARRLLRRFPNLHCDLANMTDTGQYGSLWPRAGSWTYQFEKAGQIIPEWKAVVLEFPGRFVLGMDNNEQKGWVNGGWNRRLNRFRSLLDQLPASVASALAHENAVRLFGPTFTPDSTPLPFQTDTNGTQAGH